LRKVNRAELQLVEFSAATNALWVSADS